MVARFLSLGKPTIEGEHIFYVFVYLVRQNDFKSLQRLFIGYQGREFHSQFIGTENLVGDFNFQLDFVGLHWITIVLWIIGNGKKNQFRYIRVSIRVSGPLVRQFFILAITRNLSDTGCPMKPVGREASSCPNSEAPRSKTTFQIDWDLLSKTTPGL